MTHRLAEIEQFKQAPILTQQKTLFSLLKRAKNTQYGKQYNFKTIQNERDYKQNVPIVEYDDLKFYINKILCGEKNVLWSSPIKWMAKSSGTTNDKSKFIPVSKESFNNCHYKAARDVLGTYASNFPNNKLFEGKGIILGGSHEIHSLNNNIRAGDLSALLVQNMSHLGRFLSSINLEISLMNDWETKLNKLAEYYIPKRVSNILGVPSWMLVFLKRVLEITGKNTISEVWKDLELYIHGGVSLTPYKSHFQEVIGNNLNYQQTYNASEGFFAMQDLPSSSEMLLMLDLGIYYEFMPLSELGATKPITLSLAEVQTGINYALVISTESGLWRYALGDTIQFSSLKPYRIIITGRTKQFINVFGEELMVDNTDKAIAAACKLTKSVVKDYTVAPIFMSKNRISGGHEWAIEFEKKPESISEFTNILDSFLQQFNSDYEAKRNESGILKSPKINIIDNNNFERWLSVKGKIGGQHKIPRLSNVRTILDEILAFDQVNHSQ